MTSMIFGAFQCSQVLEKALLSTAKQNPLEYKRCAEIIASVLYEQHVFVDLCVYQCRLCQFQHDQQLCKTPNDYFRSLPYVPFVRVLVAVKKTQRETWLLHTYFWTNTRNMQPCVWNPEIFELKHNLYRRSTRIQSPRNTILQSYG